MLSDDFPYPRTARRNAWNSPTIRSRSISAKPIASYPPRAVLWDYIKGRVEKADVRKWVRFSTPVRMVRFDEETTKFTVTAHDRAQDRMYDEEFDYVVVASGHFSTPNVPYFEGVKTFNGRVLHAHDFRDAAGVQGQGHPHRRPQLFGRGHRVAMLEIRCQISHHELSLEADGLQMARRISRSGRC